MKGVSERELARDAATGMPVRHQIWKIRSMILFWKKGEEVKKLC